MEENKEMYFRNFIAGYREIQAQIKKVEAEDKTSQIAKLEANIQYNEQKIQKGSKMGQKEFEKYSKEFMENIAKDETELKELKRVNEETLPERTRRKQELENYKQNVRNNMKEKKDELLSQLESQELEHDEFLKLDEAIAEIPKQIDAIMEEYNAILKVESENPKAVKDDKYKQFLLDKVNRMREELESKKSRKENLIKCIKKEINEQYRECLKDFARIDNGEKDSVLLEAESAQDMNSKKTEKKVVRKVATQNRKVENAKKMKIEKNENVEEKPEEKEEKEDNNADSKKPEEKVEPKFEGTIFAGIDEYGFEVEAPKTKNEDHKLQMEENEPEEKIFDLDDSEHAQGDNYESKKDKSGDYESEQENQQSDIEENIDHAGTTTDFTMPNSSNNKEEEVGLESSEVEKEEFNTTSPETDLENVIEELDDFTTISEENRNEQFTTDTTDLDSRFALTNDDNLKINFSVSKDGKPMIECDWGKAVKTFTLEDLDFSETEAFMRTHDVIMATIEELDDIYGTNKAEMFMDARAQSDILRKVKTVKDVAKIDINMDLRNLYKSKPDELLKTYRKDILNCTKKYNKEGIADVKMGLRTKVDDVLKNIGDVATGIFKRKPKAFKKTSKLNTLNAGDDEQIYETPEIHTLRTRHDIVVENSDNRIEKMAQDRMDKKREEGTQQVLDENQHTEIDD